MIEVLAVRLRLGPRGKWSFPSVLFSAIINLMAEQDNSASTKKRGRPATGKGLQVVVRLQPDLLELVDAYCERFSDAPSRPEAIRRLIAEKLKGQG